jgi:hypothetical protein
VVGFERRNADMQTRINIMTVNAERLGKFFVNPPRKIFRFGNRSKVVKKAGLAIYTSVALPCS